MLYRLTNRITIGNLQMNFCHEITVVSSWESLTDTATIVIPKSITVDKKPIVEGADSVFNIGDKVTIEAGYNYEHDTIFTGYVTNVKTKFPLEITCEDSMWLFKQKSYKKTFRTVTVKQLVDYLMASLGENFPIVYSDANVQLGKFRINNATGAQVLEELRKKYGIYSFFREGKMYVGFVYTHSGTDYRKRIPLQFTPNIIEDDLLFHDAQNQRVKVKATSILADNKQLTVEVGDGDGRVIERFYYNLGKADLEKMAKNVLATWKVSGLEGSLETFGKPMIRQGDAIELADNKISERNGTYLVKKVTRTFGQNGYRSRCEIDRRIS
jgi:hypothetical protein